MIDPRLRLNLVLLALTGILGFAIYWEINDSNNELPKLLTIDSESVNRIEIQRKGKTSLVLEKADDTWRITSPIRRTANPQQVNRLLEIPQTESLVQYTVGHEDLKKFSLDPPKVTLILDNTPLYFGDVDPLKMRRYVFDGQTLHLVNNNFYHLLIAVPEHFADIEQSANRSNRNGQLE